MYPIYSISDVPLEDHTAKKCTEWSFIPYCAIQHGIFFSRWTKGYLFNGVDKFGPPTLIKCFFFVSWSLYSRSGVGLGWLCHSDVTWAAGCAGLPEFLCVWVCGWVVVATDLAAGAAFCLSPIEGPKARWMSCYCCCCSFCCSLILLVKLQVLIFVFCLLRAPKPPDWADIVVFVVVAAFCC